MGKQIVVTCLVCGASVKKHRHQATCSLKCRSLLATRRRESSSTVGPCPGCGGNLPLAFTANGAAVCSRRCATVLYSRKTRSSDGYVRPDTVPLSEPDRICPGCHSTFKPKRKRQVCCDHKCYVSWYDKCKRNTEARREKRRAKRLSALSGIKECALCKVPVENIVLPADLGRRSKFGNSLLHKDHIVPLSYLPSESTVRYLCWFCNLARKDNDVRYDEAIANAGEAFWKTIKRIQHGDH